MEERIGSVIKFIAAVKLDFDDLAVGDTVRIRGTATDFSQKIEVLKFDHKPVRKAIQGQFTGINLSQPVRPFNLVYRVVDLTSSPR